MAAERPGIFLMLLHGPYESAEECVEDYEQTVMYLEFMIGSENFKPIKCTEAIIDEPFGVKI